jgi:hypothetical protein
MKVQQEAPMAEQEHQYYGRQHDDTPLYKYCNLNSDFQKDYTVKNWVSYYAIRTVEVFMTTEVNDTTWQYSK